MDVAVSFMLSLTFLSYKVPGRMLLMLILRGLIGRYLANDFPLLTILETWAYLSVSYVRH